MSALPLNKNYGSTSVYFRPCCVFKKIKLKLKSPFNTPSPRIVLRQFSVMFQVCLLFRMATRYVFTPTLIICQRKKREMRSVLARYDTPSCCFLLEEEIEYKIKCVIRILTERINATLDCQHVNKGHFSYEAIQLTTTCLVKLCRVFIRYTFMKIGNLRFGYTGLMKAKRDFKPKAMMLVILFLLKTMKSLKKGCNPNLE